MPLIDSSSGVTSGDPTWSITGVTGALEDDFDFVFIQFAAAAGTTVTPPSDGNGTWNEEFLEEDNEQYWGFYTRTLTANGSTTQTWTLSNTPGSQGFVHAVWDGVVGGFTVGAQSAVEGNAGPDNPLVIPIGGADTPSEDTTDQQIVFVGTYADAIDLDTFDPTHFITDPVDPFESTLDIPLVWADDYCYNIFGAMDEIFPFSQFFDSGGTPGEFENGVTLAVSVRINGEVACADEVNQTRWGWRHWGGVVVDEGEG